MRRILTILAFLTTTAHAEPRRYTRKAGVPTTPASHPVHAAPHPAQPAVTADDVLAIEEGNQPIRREQERVLEGLVRDTPDDDPQKPDLIFRLAEQYAQQLRFWRLKEIEATVSRP
jgi:hypothetical protein